MVKIKEVAERAGVSPTSVSHVLSRKRSVSDQMRQKVEEAILALGYAPNPLARGLRTGRTGSVAFVLPDICNPIYAEMARSLQAGLAMTGEDMLVYNSNLPGQPDTNSADRVGRAIIERVRSGGVDGLIVAEAALQGAERELTSIGCPAVYMGDLEESLVDSVAPDETSGVTQIAQHLLDRGHLRIAHVTGPHNLRMSGRRRDAFENALVAAGAPIPDHFRFEGSFLAPSGHHAANWLAELMKQPDGPTAVFVAGSIMACSLLARLHDFGISVPEDIAVATYDLHQGLEDFRPQLTTAGTAPTALAHRALEMLRDRLSGYVSGPPRREILPGTLHIGTTT